MNDMALLELKRGEVKDSNRAGSAHPLVPVPLCRCLQKIFEIFKIFEAIFIMYCYPLVPVPLCRSLKKIFEIFKIFKAIFIILSSCTCSTLQVFPKDI